MAEPKWAHPPRPKSAVALLGILLALLCLHAVAAHDEGEASRLDPQVASVWHEPTDVQPGEPWNAYLRLAPNATATQVRFQVCRVGQECFGPPAKAISLGQGTFTFASSQASPAGPVEFGSGWRVGVKWYLGNGTASSFRPFPPDPTGSSACVDEAALACQEAHYAAFSIAATPEAAPTAWMALPLLLAGTAALARRPHA